MAETIVPEATPTKLDSLSTPVLLVVVDTEEEFDWAAPHARSNTAVSAMSKISLGQAIFDSYGVRPCYVVDYPVATHERAMKSLCEFQRSGSAIVGAHLHPWVNPPYIEPVDTKNTFPGNLPFDVERQKLIQLSNKLEAALQGPVTIYKAGRYGIGPNTPRILAELGFQVDLSPAPAFDYSSDGGPDFARHTNNPMWLDRVGGLLSIPCTGAFIGRMSGIGHLAYPLFTRPVLNHLRAPGVLAKLRMLERIRLSPEGFALDDMVRLTRELVKRGVSVLTLSFHSPSLLPGCTPYVRTHRELSDFLDRIRAYLDFFQQEVGGRFSTPGEVRQLMMTRERSFTLSEGHDQQHTE